VNAPAIAVSGLHRGENPQPGAGIIRALRRALPGARFVGLVYDIKESGIYAADGPDEVQLMPYPSAGGGPFLDRLDALQRRAPIDMLIPSLDAEIELLVHLRAELARRGVRVCLPDSAALRRRAKAHLPELARACGVAVPETRIAHDLGAARKAARELGCPLLVKGAYYEARPARHATEAHHAAAALLAEWGAPVILQRCVEGPEFNVLGLGDGRGGVAGSCSIRKTALSDTGKGLGGIVVSDARLDRIVERIVRELRWLGPFEIELIYDKAARDYVLIEMNPRFPAWIDFPAMIGANFPAALVHLLRHGTPGEPPPACAPGTFFLRHQIEVVGDISRYAALLAQEADVFSDDGLPARPSFPNLSSHENAILPAAPHPAPRL
jgi:carbamoyl-phosphate synthase large subunit